VSPEPGPAAAGPDHVYAAFEQAITDDQRIDVFTAAAGSPALRELVRALDKLRIIQPWWLTNAKLSRPRGTVQLTGLGRFALPEAGQAHGTGVQAEITYTDALARDQFVVTLRVTTAGWTFGTTFPVLPPCMFASGTKIELRASYLAGVRLDAPSFTATATAGDPVPLTLSGSLPLAAVFDRFADFFGPWPLRLDGSVVLPVTAAEPPQLDLTARSRRGDLVIGPAKLGEFRLVLGSYTGLDPYDNPETALSALQGVAALTLGGEAGVTGDAYVDLLQMASAWRMIVEFDPGKTRLDRGLAGIAALLGGPVADFTLPPGLEVLPQLSFTEMEATFRPPGVPRGPQMEYVAVTLQSTAPWRTPIPFLAVSDVGTRWLVAFAGTSVKLVSGSFFGSVVVGPAEDPTFVLDLTASYPQFSFQALLAEGEIPLDKAIGYFFGATGPDSRLSVSALELEGDPRAQTLYGAAEVTFDAGDGTGDFPIPLPGGVEIALSGVSLWIAVQSGAVTGGLAGTFILREGAPDGLPDPMFYLSADYTGSKAGQGWVFSGGLLPDSVVELVHLISKFAGQPAPDWAPKVTLELLDLRVATGSGAYRVAGAVSGLWRPNLFGEQLTIAARAAVDIRRDSAKTALVAQLAGSFAVNRIMLSAAVNVIAGEATYEFKADFGGLTISAVTAWRGTGNDRHQVITFQVGGVTLGELIEYLVNLAAPTLGFRLESPWDLLGRVELSRFLVTIDPKLGAVELTYQAGATLPAMEVDTITLRYQPVRGKPSVTLRLTGQFLDKRYDDIKPLSWDLLSSSPPAVPGRGRQLLDLSYLGIGQRVSLRGELPPTVRATLNQLAQALEPAKPDSNPLRGPAGAKLRFDPDSQWLIGLDTTIAGTVALGVVFNDPRLYGLAIGVSGEKAGALAGLSFEVLYKKISDDVGVFRVELRVPDAFRKIQLGAVSVTLGILVVEIYTDGSFLVDLGFPHQRDFTRSFTVEVTPFIGRGGIYFGVLSGEAATRVPAISNGTFAPVILLGVGLVIGVGKEFSAGPLSGGAFVEVIGIFEGVLAWFNPAGSQTATEPYYWVQAVVAIHGKVYGTVDFKVIQISVTIEAWAEVSVVLAAYRAALFRLSAKVRVSASVKIIFFWVSFSFEASVDLAFTVGSDQQAPWVLADGTGGGAARWRATALPPLASHPWPRALPATARLAAAGLASQDRAAAPDPGWDPSRLIFPDSPRTADITMLPVFSMTNVPIGWNADPPAGAGTPRIAFCLFAPDGTSPAPPGGARPPRSAALSATAVEPRDLAGPQIIEALLRWSISAKVPMQDGQFTGAITAHQLRDLVSELDRPATADGPFGLTDLARFLRANLHLRIAGDPDADPQGPHPAAPTPAAVGGTVVPMPPFLSWYSPQAGDRDFAHENPVGPLYTWGVARYAARVNAIERPEPPQPPDDPDHYEPMAGYVFRDWCLMIAKAAVQAAADTLAAWPLDITGPMSLTDIANCFPTVSVSYVVRAGDTLDNVASALLASVGELTFHNPELAGDLRRAAAGAVLTIKLGVSPQTVAEDCATVAVSVPSVPLGTIEYQVTQSDTLTAIAGRFGLDGPVDLFPGDRPALAGDPRLLRPGAAIHVPAQTVPWTAAPLLAAAVFFARYHPFAAVPETPWYVQSVWYAQAVADLNPDHVQGGAGATIPAGTRLQVPRALNDKQPQPNLYVSVAGDTVNDIGAALALAQNYVTGGDGPAGWPKFRDAVRATGTGAATTDAATTVTIPAAETSVQPDETLNRLRLRLIAQAGDLPALLAWLGTQAILMPLALIPVPGVMLDVAPGATLGDLAQHAGLPLPDLAGRIPADVAIFDGTDEPFRVTITSLPAQSADVLITTVMTGDLPARVTGLSSRQLMSGLRLPEPRRDERGHMAATGPEQALYELTRQMFTGPVPDLANPDELALEVIVSVNPGVGWIKLNDSKTVGPADGHRTLAAQIPGFDQLNPAIAAVPGRLRPGIVVVTDPLPLLTFSYTNQQLHERYPATALKITPQAGPAPLAVADRVPRSYGLDHKITLQAPEPLLIPSTGETLSGTVTAWPFPDALLERARSGSDLSYDVIVPSGQTGGDVVEDATFATLLSFGVRRLAGQEHVYELLGADVAGRDLALRLWRYLTQPRIPPLIGAYLGVAPQPDVADTSGLALLAADPAATILIKTNQSTRSVPPAAAGAAADADVDTADFADLANFCLLLWEGSITGGVGYYLRFATSTGADLPAGVFDEQGTTRLHLLLVIADEQQPAAPGGRALLPFSTCAVVGPRLDPSVPNLFIAAAGSSEEAGEVDAAATADTVAQPSMPPGTAGFTLTLPDPGDAEDRDARLHRLFSLPRYAIPATSGSPFELPVSGLPAGPQQEDGQHLPLWQRERKERWRRAGRTVSADPPPVYWRYDQALPMTRYAPRSPAPAVPGLPSPAGDPYRGITGSTLPVAGVQLGFADVLGNTTAPPAPGQGLVSVPVGYTDALLGVANWPAVTLSYAVYGADGPAALVVTVTPQPAAIAPMPGTAPEPAAEGARRQAEQWAKVYYQLLGGRTGASIRTTLHQDPDGRPAEMPADGAALWRYSAAAHAFAAAAAALRPAIVSGTLTEISSGYGVGLEDIAATNIGRPVAAIFGSAPKVVPAYVVFAAGDTAEAIATRPRNGWPTPGDGAGLLALPENRAELPLRPQTLLRTPVQVLTVDPGSPALAILAEVAGSTPGALADDNAGRPVLRPGFIFELDGQHVEVPEEEPCSLDAVRKAFADLGAVADVATIATIAADKPGMFQAGADLTSEHYLTGAEETLDANESGFSGTDLAEKNGLTADVFDDGALVYLGAFGAAEAVPQETLGDFAARFGCPPALLLTANAGAELPAGAIVIPGAAVIPDAPAGGGPGIRIPFCPAGTDTLADVASRFATTDQELGRANAELPGVLAGGQDVTVRLDGSEVSTRTRDGDSLAAVWQRLKEQDERVTLADVIAAISVMPGYLADPGLLLCPPAVLPADGGPLAPADAEAAYGISATLFAQANAGTLGLIQPDVDLTDPGTNVTVTTVAHDTLNSLASRFAVRGAQTGIAGIVTANRGVRFLRAGSAALLPPAPVQLPVVLGQVGPLAVPVFPLTVELVLRRPAGLVDPALRDPAGDSPAESVASVVPAPAARDEGDQTLTLAAFAAAFHAAFPDLRLGTARTGAASGTGAPAPDLWATDFRPEGIAEVTVAAGVAVPGGDAPRYFALRPLFNNLVTRLGVLVRPLLADGSLAPDPVPTDFQGVDVEVWARRLLADIDLFLTAAYAAGVYADPAGRPALSKVLAAKRLLVEAVAAGLATVLDVPDPGADAGLDAATQVLEQELAISLSRAYDAAVLIQYDAEVNSPWTRGAKLPPARLSGTAEPATASAAEQPYTLTAATTSLGRSHSQVTFLMRVPDPQHHGKINVDLDYGLLDLQFGITSVAGIDGYEASQWLAFYPPLADPNKPPAVHTYLGSAEVPVPLRAYPAQPVLLGQSAAATAPAKPPPTLAEARLWTYGLTYTHSHAEQDEVLVTATFNWRPTPAVTDSADDVVTALAKYTAVADGLWPLLAYYADDRSGEAGTAARAAGTFADLVAGVAALWFTHWPGRGAPAPEPSGQPVAGPQQRRNEFRVRVGYRGANLHTVTLSAPGDGQVGAWPEVSCRGPDGAPVGLTGDPPAGRVRLYRAQDSNGIPVGAQPVLTLEWPGLPVTEYQNARAELSVRRNQQLLGPQGPPTRKAFVYQTPLTEAPAAVVPALNWPDAIDISGFGPDVGSALREAFKALSPAPSDFPATVGIRYGHPMVAAATAAQSVSAYVPVALAPSLKLTAEGSALVVTQLEHWLAENSPAVVPGRSWAFSLAIQSELDSSTRRPLLNLDQLIYRFPAGPPEANRI
jgi:hypothetical protein